MFSFRVNTDITVEMLLIPEKSCFYFIFPCNVKMSETIGLFGLQFELFYILIT